MSPNNGIIWELLCDCGVTTYAPASYVVSGHKKSCGCFQSKLMRKDFTGTKNGRLLFIEPVTVIDNHVVWRAICDCGNICEAMPGRGGKSCGCLRIEQLKIGRARKYTPYISSARAVWRSNYHDCEFDIFLLLSQQPCYYCNGKPYRSKNMPAQRQLLPEGKFIYNGLDRLNSNEGHIIDNIVPCCYECNKSKFDATFVDFIKRIEKIKDNALQLLEINYTTVEIDIEKLLLHAQNYVRKLILQAGLTIPISNFSNNRSAFAYNKIAI